MTIYPSSQGSSRAFDLNLIEFTNLPKFVLSRRIKAFTFNLNMDFVNFSVLNQNAKRNFFVIVEYLVSKCVHF